MDKRPLSHLRKKLDAALIGTQDGGTFGITLTNKEASAIMECVFGMNAIKETFADDNFVVKALVEENTKLRAKLKTRSRFIKTAIKNLQKVDKLLKE